MALLPGLAGRSVLHNEIFFSSGNVVFVRAMAYLELARGEKPSAGTGEAMSTPECRFSRIGLCLWSFSHAPEQVHQKDACPARVTTAASVTNFCSGAIAPLHIVRRLVRNSGADVRLCPANA